MAQNPKHKEGTQGWLLETNGWQEVPPARKGEFPRWVRADEPEMEPLSTSEAKDVLFEQMRRNPARFTVKGQE